MWVVDSSSHLPFRQDARIRNLQFFHHRLFHVRENAFVKFPRVRVARANTHTQRARHHVNLLREIFTGRVIAHQRVEPMPFRAHQFVAQFHFARNDLQHIRCDERAKFQARVIQRRREFRVEKVRDSVDEFERGGMVLQC